MNKEDKVSALDKQIEEVEAEKRRVYGKLSRLKSERLSVLYDVVIGDVVEYDGRKGKIIAFDNFPRVQFFRKDGSLSTQVRNCYEVEKTKIVGRAGEY
jgi:hypothetical protein